jgi:hypothetical protein
MISSRQELKEYCLRKLGAPVINIEIDDTQMDDRLDDAIQTFHEQHYDGSEIKWVHYALTQDDLDSGYIEIDETVLAVLEVRPNNQILAQQDMFSYQYQITLNELSPWRPFDQVDYFMRMTNLQQALDMTSVTPTFEFTRHARKLKIADNLNRLGLNYPFAIKVAIIDEEDLFHMYNDRWLKSYATALFKQQWGSNVKKYDQVQLIGGLTINGQTIFDEANAEIEKLIEELETKYTIPVGFIVG